VGFFKTFILEIMCNTAYNIFKYSFIIGNLFMFKMIETPQLVLDKNRLEKNVKRFMALADEHDVLLRPHLKTSKSVDVADIATGGQKSSVTVSTLKEADYFAAHGYVDILVAAGITPNKFDYAQSIIDEYDPDLCLITDDVSVAKSAVEFAEQKNCTLSFLIELDCGEHRGGVVLEDDDLVTIAKIFTDSNNINFKGVMTHAGHSYGTNDRTEVVKIAAIENKAVVDAAALLSGYGIDCDITSVGSTPTFLFGENFDGVSEVRAGIYMFFDLSQFSRNVCALNEIAVSVLATVIGHNKSTGTLVLDAGMLALSKDIGAHRFLPDAGYGYLCDAMTMKRLGSLCVNGVHQEHGSVNIIDDMWFDQMPVGSLVRILPNHACPTAAAYDQYLVVENNKISGTWPRINGW